MVSMEIEISTALEERKSVPLVEDLVHGQLSPVLVTER